MENKKVNKSLLIGLICAAAVLVIAVCAIGFGLMGKTRIMDRNEALEHALADAGLAVSDITLIRQELERDDGQNRYEIEFRSPEHVYRYEIDASSGAIEGVSINALNEGTAAVSGQGSQPDQGGGQPGQPSEAGGQEASGQGQSSSQPGEGGAQQCQPPEAGGQEASGQGQGSGQPGQGDAQPGQPGSPVETVEDAKATALADAGLSEADVTFVKEKLDWDDGVAVYDLEFYSADTEYEYEINASTGAIMDKSAELFGHHGTGGAGSAAGGSYIGVDQAKEIAAGHAGFGISDVFFTKAKLEQEHGRAEYEIEFYKDRMEYEYTIDASTGDILEHESEYDD